MYYRGGTTLLVIIVTLVTSSISNPSPKTILLVVRHVKILVVLVLADDRVKSIKTVTFSSGGDVPLLQYAASPDELPTPPKAPTPRPSSGSRESTPPNTKKPSIKLESLSRKLSLDTTKDPSLVLSYLQKNVFDDKGENRLHSVNYNSQQQRPLLCKNDFRQAWNSQYLEQNTHQGAVAKKVVMYTSC